MITYCLESINIKSISRDLNATIQSLPLSFLMRCVVFLVFLTFILCLVYGDVQDILCCVFVLFVFVLCLVYTMLPVSLDCPLLIAPSISLTDFFFTLIYSLFFSFHCNFPHIGKQN